MSIACTIYDQPSGQQLADWTDRTEDAILRTNENGFLSAAWRVPMAFREAARWYGRSNLHVEWTDRAARRVWEGRWEEPRIDQGGLGVTAFGYWSCFTDVPHTGLWSSSQFNRWKVADKTFSANYNPAPYDFKLDSLSVSWKKGEPINPSNRAGIYLEAPDGAAKQIEGIDITYDAFLPAGARIVISSYTRDAGGFVTGITQQWSDVFNVTGNRFGSRKIQPFNTGVNVLLEVYADPGGSYTADSGTYYVRFKAARAFGTTALYCYADQIASYLAQNTPGIASSIALIQSPALDLTDEIYEDIYPAEILRKLTRPGDVQKRRYEAAVWENRMLQFQPQGSRGRTWHVELDGTPEVERALVELRNDIYAVYQEATGRTRRTERAADAISQARYRLTRRATIRAQTTDGSATGQAYAQRDAYLADHKEIRTRARLPIARVRDQWGNLYPNYVVRGNDTIVIPQLSPLLGDAFAKIRSFRVTETEYQVDTDRLAVTPEVPLPTLDTLLARQEEGLSWLNQF